MTEPTSHEDIVGQQLSGFLDDALPAAEAELLLRRLSKDRGLHATAGRYLLIGESLRSDRASGPSRQFSARIAAAIAQEGALAGSSGRRASGAVVRWLKPAAGLAVAASVAALAVITLQSDSGQDTLVADNGQAPTTVSQPVVPGSTESASYVVPASSGNAPLLVAPARLTNYVVAHSEYSSPLGRRNLLTGLLAAEDQAPGSAESAETADASDASSSER